MPWLAMQRLALPFERIHIRLRHLESRAQLLKFCPSRLVPALLHGDLPRHGGDGTAGGPKWQQPASELSTR